MWTREFNIGVFLAWKCEFVYVLICIAIRFYSGEVPVYPVRDGYLCCAKFLRVPCLRIQCGCKCEKASWGTAGKGAFGESQLSETPIVWRNPSVSFIRVLVNEIKVVLDSVFDGWLRCSRHSRQPACILPCSHLVIFVSACMCNLCVAFLTSFSKMPHKLRRTGLQKRPSDWRIPTGLLMQSGSCLCAHVYDLCVYMCEAWCNMKAYSGGK